MGHDPTRGSVQEVFRISRLGRIGSGRTGSRGVRNRTGRVRPANEGFKSDGSGQITRTRPDPQELTRPVYNPPIFRLKLDTEVTVPTSAAASSSNSR